MKRGSYKGKVTEYTGQYPDIPEFQEPWQHCVTVGQGSGEISSSKPLISEGFGYWSAFIGRNIGIPASEYIVRPTVYNARLKYEPKTRTRLHVSRPFT
jgi:hypothetical protein